MVQDIFRQQYVRQNLTQDFISTSQPTEAESLGHLGAAARGSGAVALSKALQDDRDALVRRPGFPVFQM